MTQWIVSSSILILIVIGLRFLLRKRVKPILQYALWALVLVRLLVPAQFGSTGISLQNAVEKAPVIQQMELADEITYFVYHVDGTATGYYEYQPPLNHIEPEAPATKPVPQAFTQQEAQSITRIRQIKGLLQKIWLGGMAVFGLIFLLSNLRFALRLRNAKKAGREGNLPIYITDKVETPCLFGLLRPGIYLPPAVADEPRHRDYSVAHEATHYRHGDALWAVLRCVCIVLHWYNPLVWWAAVLSREDGEIACDEATIAALGEDLRGDYGRVLVDLTCRKPTDLLQTATTMTGSAKGLKQRISMIVKRPKMAIYALICLILVASVAVGCTFTGGKQRSAGDNTQSTEPTDSATDPTEDSAEPSGAEKVQDSKHIVTAANAEYLPNEDARKAIADYAAGYTPYTSKMAIGVLTGVTEITFETDYDIAKTTVYRIARVDENNADAELRGYSGGKPKAKWDGRTVTVDIGWWHESDSWTKSNPVWSYVICVKDTSGTFHNYYFRVEYATTDAVGLHTEKDYEAFLNNNYWYQSAMGCWFEKPEDLPALFYFYGGVGDYTQATGDELAFILEAYKKKNPNIESLDYALNYERMPVAKMNEALSILGVTVEDIKLPISWVYHDKTDCYYFWVSDARIVDIWAVTKVEKGADGKIIVHWQTDARFYGWETPSVIDMVLTMQLQSDGTYRILSNVPIS